MILDHWDLTRPNSSLFAYLSPRLFLFSWLSPLHVVCSSFSFLLMDTSASNEFKWYLISEIWPVLMLVCGQFQTNVPSTEIKSGDAYLMLGLNPTYLPTLPFTRILLVYHFQLHSRSEIGCCGILHETYFSFESSGIHTRINSGQILLGTTLLSLGYTLHWFSTIWRTYRVFEWKRPLVSMTASSSVTLLALWTLGRAGGPLFLLRRSTIN